jgi:hypothetical protein
MKYLLLFEAFDQDKIDNILDKISDIGYDNLSQADKDYLANAFGGGTKEQDKPKQDKPIKTNNMKTGKLIDHFTDEEKKWLQSRIDNPDVYSLPTMDEVIEYLKSTSDSEPSEEVMDDLIIQYLEDEGLMFDFC